MTDPRELRKDVEVFIEAAGGTVRSWPIHPRVRFECEALGLAELIASMLRAQGFLVYNAGPCQRFNHNGIVTMDAFEITLPPPPPSQETRFHSGELSKSSSSPNPEMEEFRKLFK